MPTYKFKPEFEKKLKKLRIKTKFLNNIKSHKHQTETIKKRCEKLNNSSYSWRSFISSAFMWESSPEGFHYWLVISKK